MKVEDMVIKTKRGKGLLKLPEWQISWLRWFCTKDYGEAEEMWEDQ